MKKQIGLLAIVLCIHGIAVSQQLINNTFGKGINVMASDSSMSMKFHYRIQSLFIGEYDQSSETWETNALIRRSRLKFSGFAFTPKLKYKGEMGLSNRDIAINKEDGNTRDAARLILDAVIKWQFANKWQLWVGQTKLPGNRERVVSSADLQFVDRSLVNSKFNVDRDMGFQLHGKINLGSTFLVTPKFALTKGEGRDITSSNYGGFNYTAHVDFLPFGKFEGKKQDFILADINRQSTPKLAIGVTYNLNQGATRQQGQLGSFIYQTTYPTDSTMEIINGANDLTAIQIDLLFKYQGFSLFGEYASTTAAEKLDNLSKGYNTGSGYNIQAGYVMKNNWEIAGRYTSVMADDENYSSMPSETQYTLGLSKYVLGHSLKVQSDISYIIEEGSDDGNIMFRLQTEMQF